jgi:hypothetical protein
MFIVSEIVGGFPQSVQTNSGIASQITPLFLPLASFQNCTISVIKCLGQHPEPQQRREGETISFLNVSRAAVQSLRPLTIHIMQIYTRSLYVTFSFIRVPCGCTPKKDREMFGPHCCNAQALLIGNMSVLYLFLAAT